MLNILKRLYTTSLFLSLSFQINTVLSGPAIMAESESDTAPLNQFLTPPSNLKLSYYLKSTPWRQYSHVPPLNCQPPNDNHASQAIETTATFWSPDQTKIHKMGLLFTAYSLKTSCYRGFFGGVTKNVHQDSPTKLSLLDKNWSEGILEMYKMKDPSQLKMGANFTEVKEEPYICIWLATTEIEQIYLNIKVIKIDWTPRGILTYPEYNDKCSQQLGECPISVHSLLFWEWSRNEIHKDDCSLRPIHSSSGLIQVEDNDKFSRFISAESHFLVSFLIPFREEDIYCRISGVPVLLTQEKIFVSFGLHQSENILDWLIRTKNSAHYPKHSDALSVKGAQISQRVTSGPKREVELAQRRIEYAPSSPSEVWMFEQAAWSISELEHNIFQNTRSLISYLSSSRYQLCMIRSVIQTLIYQNPSLPLVPYLKLVLGTDSFISKTTRGMGIFKLGLPVFEIHFLNPAKWCNGSLTVEFKTVGTGDWIHGILLSTTGKILEVGPEEISNCDPTSPSKFLIPQIDGSYWELLSGTQIATNQGNFVFHLDPNVQLNHPFLSFTPISALHDLETSMSSLDDLSQPTKFVPKGWSSLWELNPHTGFTNLMTWFGIPALTSILPVGFLIVGGLMIIRCLSNLTPSYRARASGF
uniref:Glycoprotein n=1 Tax=Coleopteran rhabdo-related virus OKIAV29 TaxID=2746289 RepID=A0A7D7F3C3_9RHAB|nr:glycoprotein [Coleopteran rhabdo-related virus OKIAV29]